MKRVLTVDLGPGGTALVMRYEGTDEVGATNRSVNRSHLALCVEGKVHAVSGPSAELATERSSDRFDRTPTRVQWLSRFIDSSARTLKAEITLELGGEPAARRLDTPPPASPHAHQRTQEVFLRHGAVATAGVSLEARRRWRPLLAFLGVILLFGGGVWFVSRTATNSNSGQGIPGVAAPPDGAFGDTSPSVTSTPTRTATALRNAPNLVGLQLTDAQNSLPSSLKISTVETVNPDVADGMVIAQDPEAGEPLSGEIELTVVRKAVEVFLDSLQPVSGEWSANTHLIALSGKNFLHAVAARIDRCFGSDFVEYNLAKGYRRLVATGGIDDNSTNVALKTQLAIFADGRRVSHTTLEYGKPVPLDVDLSGVLRLRIQWQSIAGTDCTGSNYFALGEAKLLGLPDEVPRPSISPTN